MTAPHFQPSKDAGCTGKTRFESFDLANRINRKRNKGRNKFQRGAYHCSVCLGWHLGRRNTLNKQKERDMAREKDETRIQQQLSAGL